MAQLTVQEASYDGITPSYVSADVAGDSFKNYSRAILHVENGDTVAKTVTIASNPCNHGFNHDVAVTVNAGETKLIGPFEGSRFNDENNYVNVTYDDVTSVQVAVIKL